MKRFYLEKGRGTALEQVAASARAGAHGFCGGRGVCGRCRVRFASGAPLPSAADRRFFSPQELREGYRLACTARPVSDCDIELCFAAEPAAEIVTVHEAEAADAERTARQGRAEPPENTAPADIPPGQFCAVDLGTTTVVMQLVDRRSGAVLDTQAFRNPQRIYGTDVLSRISAAESGRAAELQKCMEDALADGLRAMEAAGGQPDTVVVSGNTAMGHLLLGYPVDTLGKAPFQPYHIGGTRFSVAGYPAVFLPGISAFVGADIVSGLYACGMAADDAFTLFIDLGTNGEMAAGNRERIVCSAAAAGCAFEGGGAQAVGTDITAAAFDLLQSGVMDETGLLREPWFDSGCRVQGNLLLRQQDIRSLQMAKAAICAGVSILLDETDGWERLERVYLAGGFGYYLDVDKAAGIGLIPAALQGRCRAVGNASLAGAVRYGRYAAPLPGSGMCAGAQTKERQESRRAEREKLAHIIAVSEPVNLAEHPAFESRYIDAMAFRKMETL